MTRPTRVYIDNTALLHNVGRVKQCAPGKKIIAMLKANAYGAGVNVLLTALEGQVDAFGVASLEEALAIRRFGSRSPCVLFQGVFSPDELMIAAKHRFQCVIHHQAQLHWLLATPLPEKIKIWVKVNTGMHRLGFPPAEVNNLLKALHACTWVDEEIGLITHLASADEPQNSNNQQQLACLNALVLPSEVKITRSIANSAAILAIPEAHAEVVRPGLMLYGISPFANRTASELGLLPVVHFLSAISAIHHHPAGVAIGYGGAWQSAKPSIIGIVPAGYGDGYPRHIAAHTPIWINGFMANIVGRVSMDMLMVDLTECPGIAVGDPVELWGRHLPIEQIAQAAGTIPYELISQLTLRVRQG